MSKHTVTMKSLIDENAQLRIHAHKLEVEIAGYKARAAAPQKLWNPKFSGPKGPLQRPVRPGGKHLSLTNTTSRPARVGA